MSDTGVACVFKLYALPGEAIRGNRNRGHAPYTSLFPRGWSSCTLLTMTGVSMAARKIGKPLFYTLTQS